MSKANQSTYNPLVEDVTPVTPENMQVSIINLAFCTFFQQKLLPPIILSFVKISLSVLC